MYEVMRREGDDELERSSGLEAGEVLTLGGEQF